MQVNQIVVWLYGMKISKIKKSESKEYQAFSQRLKKGTLEQLDKLAGELDISRNFLVELVLEQCLNDKNFTLKVPE